MQGSCLKRGELLCLCCAELLLHDPAVVNVDVFEKSPGKERFSLLTFFKHSDRIAANIRSNSTPSNHPADTPKPSNMGGPTRNASRMTLNCGVDR
jgi:hypothetical protein